MSKTCFVSDHGGHQQIQELEEEIRILKANRNHDAKLIIETSKIVDELRNENENLKKRHCFALTHGEARTLYGRLNADAAIEDLRNDFLVVDEEAKPGHHCAVMSYGAVLAVVLAKEVQKLRNEKQELHERAARSGLEIYEKNSEIENLNSRLQYATAKLTVTQLELDSTAKSWNRALARGEALKKENEELKTANTQLAEATSYSAFAEASELAAKRLSIIQDMSNKLDVVVQQAVSANTEVGQARGKQFNALDQLRRLSARFAEQASSNGG